MIRRFLLAIVAVCLTTAAVSAQTFYIDKFSDPFSTSSITSGTTGPTGQSLTAAGSDIFALRTFTQNYLAGTAPDAYQLVWDGLVMNTSGGLGVKGSFKNVYTNATGGDVNFNATGTTVLSFEVNDLDHNQSVDILIRSGAGNVATISGLTIVSTPGIPYTEIVPFSSFTGTIDPSNIDQVEFSVTDLTTATQLSYDNLRLTVAVPEPTTIAMIGISGVAAAASVWYRRRKAARLLEAAVQK